jgi:hypothetical protein
LILKSAKPLCFKGFDLVLSMILLLIFKVGEAALNGLFVSEVGEAASGNPVPPLTQRMDGVFIFLSEAGSHRPGQTHAHPIVA